MVPMYRNISDLQNMVSCVTQNNVFAVYFRELFKGCEKLLQLKN